jgi:hypothetical protein
MAKTGRYFIRNSKESQVKSKKLIYICLVSFNVYIVIIKMSICFEF